MPPNNLNPDDLRCGSHGNIAGIPSSSLLLLGEAGTSCHKRALFQGCGSDCYRNEML